MAYVIIIIFSLLMISLISGQSSAPSGTIGGKDCSKCKEDFAWYNKQKTRKKIQYAAWFAARKLACALNGC